MTLLTLLLAGGAHDTEDDTCPRPKDVAKQHTHTSTLTEPFKIVHMVFGEKVTTSDQLGRRTDGHLSDKTT